MQYLNERIDKLTQQSGINFALRFHLYCARINRPIDRSYERLLKSLGGASVIRAPACGTIEWALLQMPAQLPGSRALHFLTTSWMCYAIVRVLMFESLSRLLGTILQPYLNMPGSCLLLGRMASHPQLETLAIVVCCGFHLAWRCWQHFADHDFKLTVLHFLFHSERDLERFYLLMESDKTFDDSIPDGIAIEPAAPLEPMVLPAHEWADLEKLAGGGSTSKPMDANELLLRHTMCYPVYHQGKVQFRLRPNRSREARRRLADQVIRSFLVAALVMLLCILMVGPYLVPAVHSDWRYAVGYSGCSRHLDEMLARNELPVYGFSLPKGHRLIALVADIVENLIVWVDCGLAVTFVPTFGYLLNYDILLYWSNLQSRIERTLQRARECHSIHHRPAAPRSTASSLGSGRSAGRWLRQNRVEQIDRELELEIRELQFEIFDFFNEVKRVDLFISDLLTAAILVWLASWSVVGHYFLSGTVSAFPIIMIVVELVGCVVIVTASYVLLTLRRSCLQRYTSLCSLMALDRSTQKRHFIKTIEFFTQYNRTTYRIAHSYPYEPTTFITIMGWSASCFILTLTLFTPQPPRAATVETGRP